MLTKSLLGLGFIISTTFMGLNIAHAASTLDLLGIQVIKDDLAFSVFNAIPTAASPVRDISGGGVVSYMKEVGQLSCYSDASGATCFVSDIGGAKPHDVAGTSINRRLYDILSTHALPMGVDMNGNGTPTGYLKTVVKLNCLQDAKTGQFECNIYFRQ